MTILLFCPHDGQNTGWIETADIKKPKCNHLPNPCNWHQQAAGHHTRSEWSGAELGGKYLKVETYINQWRGENMLETKVKTICCWCGKPCLPEEQDGHCGMGCPLHKACVDKYALYPTHLPEKLGELK